MVWKPIAKTIGRLGWGRDGVAAVEFALVLPLLTLMLFGTIEFGRLLVDYQVANKSVRDAVRYLSRVRDTAITDSCPEGLKPEGVLLLPKDEAGDPVGQAVNLAMRGSIDETGDYLLGYWNDASTIKIRVFCTDNRTNTFSGVYQDSKYIPELTMEATVTFPSEFAWLLPFLDDFSIKVTHNEVHIGD